MNECSAAYFSSIKVLRAWPIIAQQMNELLPNFLIMVADQDSDDDVEILNPSTLFESSKTILLGATKARRHYENWVSDGESDFGIIGEKVTKKEDAVDEADHNPTATRMWTVTYQPQPVSTFWFKEVVPVNIMIIHKKNKKRKANSGNPIVKRFKL